MPSSLGELFNSEDGTLGPYMGDVEAMMAQGHGGGNVNESAMRGRGDGPNSNFDQKASMQKPIPQQLQLTWISNHGHQGGSGPLIGPRTKHDDKGNSSKASAGSSVRKSSDLGSKTKTQQNSQDGGQGVTNHDASLEAVTKKLKDTEVKRRFAENQLNWKQEYNDELQEKLKKMELEYSKISESGAYNHNSATPTDVSKAFSILLESFENESFMDGGYSVYLDPLVRKQEFFDLFQQNTHESREFVEYYNRRKARVVETLGMEDAMTDQQLAGLLDLEFRKAAQNVWALHLLCFAFDPPASLFRVRAGAGFESKYMETPPNLEVDEDSLKEVAFMLVPGLRIDKFSTIKSSIYPVVDELTAT
ncbi:unnamed protein product [Calypogeia fissa]